MTPPNIPAHVARGRHTTVVDAAKPIFELLKKHGSISAGFIKSGLKTNGRSLKILSETGGFQMVIVSGRSKQEFHVYGISLEKLKTLLSGEIVKSFRVNFPAEKKKTELKE